MSAVLVAEAAAKFPTKTTTGVNHMAWAHRFVYRAERNDRDLLPVQITLAYMALNRKQPGA